MHYLYLFGAILGEVVGTSALKATEGFTRLGPSLIAVAGYAVAFFLLSLAVQRFPIGVLYAVWSGLGIVLIASVGAIMYGDKLDLPAIIGMALILSGVVVIQIFSQSVSH